MMVAVFVTKMKALQSFLARTPLSMYLGIVNESHDFHVHTGRYIAFDVCELLPWRLKEGRTWGEAWFSVSGFYKCCVFWQENH